VRFWRKLENSVVLYGQDVRNGRSCSLFANDVQFSWLPESNTKESWKNDKGEWQSRTDWHRVVTFGKLAEYTRTLPKGTHVMVQGALRSREYESNGVERRIFELRADTVAKLDRAERKEGGAAPSDI